MKASVDRNGEDHVDDQHTITHGITLATSGTYASPLTITSTGYVNNPGSGSAVYGPGTQAWTVVNQGRVAGPGQDGVVLDNGGLVANSGRPLGPAARFTNPPATDESGRKRPVKEFYCIVAPQRSGTTVLQRTLESGQQIKSFYEIFHANIGDNQSRYFYFLRTSEERMRRQCQPSRAAMRTQLKDFLDYLASLTPLEKIFLDVKQNSLHHLDVFWQQPISMPFFLTCANALGIKFIRLKRENLFLQALSTLVALSRNRWQLRRGSPPVEDTPIRINPRQTLGRMCVIKENNDLVDRWLQDVREVLWLSYESLFEGEHLAFEPAREIAEFCGLADTLAEIELPLEKTIPDPRSMISNYDEVLNFFKGRQFEELVVKGLG